MTGMMSGAAMTAVAVIAIFGSTAVAQEPAPSAIAPIDVTGDSVRVAYGDLNLDTDHGMDLMLIRIRRASHLVCGVAPQPMAQQLRERRCVGQAKQGAYEQLAAQRQYARYAQVDQALVLRLER